MNTLQKLYDYKSSIIDSDPKVLETQYFKIIDTIRARPNQYSIPPDRVNIKRSIIEPFKDPDVINSNKRFQLRIDTINDEPILPKLNFEYLDNRKKLRRNKEIYRDIAKNILNIENEKFQVNVFSQKPRIENTTTLLKDYELSRVYKSIGRNRRLKNYSYKEKTSNVIFPSIKKNKTGIDKIFQTEVNNIKTEGNVDSEPNVKDSKELKDHKYDEISHQKPGHVEG